MPTEPANYKSLRRCPFPSDLDYKIFINHLVKPLIENVENLEDYICNICRFEENLNDQLVVSDLQKMKKQIQKHVIWKQIYDPYLPMTHPHEFTILLLNQLIIDYEEIDRDMVEMNALQNQYVSLIIRFINGLLDYYQKAKYAMSLIKLAEKLKIPSWIVDLRHMATHERELPNIKTLRKGIVWSLTYLVEFHWMCNEEKNSDSDEELKETAKIIPWGEKRKYFNLFDNKSSSLIASWDENWSLLSSRKWAFKEASLYYHNLKTFKNFKSEFKVENKQSKQKEFVNILEEFKTIWKELRDDGKEKLITNFLTTPITGIKVPLLEIFIFKFHRFDYMIVQIAEKQNTTKLIYPLIDFNSFCKQYKDKIPQFKVEVLKEMVLMLKTRPDYSGNIETIKEYYKQKIKLNKELSVKSASFDFKPKISLQTNNDANRQFIFDVQEDWSPKPFGAL
ncbi:hypothetical protein QEN19_000600 [Hanseniaspora menglaensis]